MLFELTTVLAEVVWGVGTTMLENWGKSAGAGLMEGLVDQVFGDGEALAQDQALAVAVRQNKAVLAQFTQNQQHLAQVQTQQNTLKRQELALAVQQGALTQRLGEANLDLGWRKLEQEGLIEREKLNQQRELARQEIELQVWLQAQSLQLQERHHQEGWAEQRQAQALQIQANWDLQGNLGTIWSRQELEKMQADPRLKLICAQMQVTKNCPAHFQEDVAMEVESRMFSVDFGDSVQCYSRFFQDQTVFDAHASRLKDIITYPPVIMAFSRMMNPRIYFHYMLWNSKSADFLRQGDGKFNQELNWKDLKRQLETKAREQGQDIPEADILEVLGNHVIALHQLFAYYLIDLHEVVDGATPYVRLRLEQLDWGDLKPLMWTYQAPLLAQLRELQRARVAAFEALLREAEVQQLREEDEQEQRRREEQEQRRREEQERLQAEAKQQAEQESARLRQEQEERRRKEEEEEERKAESERQRAAALDEVELKSEKGIDYIKLRDLLKAQHWKEADQETYEVMIRAVGKKSGDWFTSEDLLEFPCKDLKTIDSLWVKYSNGHFGFSVQKHIYVECGAKLDGKHPGNEIWNKFGDRVGWRKDGNWLSYDNLDPSISSPNAEFPLKGTWVGGRCGIFLAEGLFSRIKTCEV